MSAPPCNLTGDFAFSADKLRQGYQTEVKIWLYSNIYHNEFRFANMGVLRITPKSGRRETGAGPADSAGTGARTAAAAGRRASRALKVSGGTSSTCRTGPALRACHRLPDLVVRTLVGRWQQVEWMVCVWV